MKTIQISTDVFAAIWSNRLAGEDSEDAILSRLLKVKTLQTDRNNSSNGVFIPEYGVTFPPEFEIFRKYKGTEYRARVTDGAWLLLNNNKLYPSLHKLSWAVVSGRENAWNNWKFKTHTGGEASIDSLRKEETIKRRL